ncbi:hypothetical protein ACHAPQ_007660 [Fusarium lateritium]
MCAEPITNYSNTRQNQAGLAYIVCSELGIAIDLEPIKIPQVKLETHLRDKKVLLNVVSPPDRNDTIKAIAQNKKGTAVLLQMYQQPKKKRQRKKTKC